MQSENPSSEEAKESVEQRRADVLLEALLSGATLQDIQQVPPEFMEGMYAHAYDFYQKGRLKEAETLFRFLFMYDFYNAEYALGLGAVFQLKKEHTKAIDIYALAFNLKPTDYRPVFYSGECNLMIGRVGNAKKCFELVCENTEDPVLVERARAYTEAIKRSGALAKEDIEENAAQAANM